ncbi:MAG: hypothetical protein L6Q35_14385 [Phycisphaerales bacterium]|nr:hypothetical protein [Phycisphaerales bacterium]
MARLVNAGLAVGMVLGLTSAAQAAVTVTQGASAPTYATTLNFDEVGGPTGEVMGSEWSAIGLSSLIGGAGVQVVNQFNTGPGMFWLGEGNAFGAPWGAFMTFSNDLTAFSCQYWDTSGPATMMGGGAIVVALSNGVEVGSLFITDPAWGGVGDTWVNIVADGGSTFDEIRLVGFGFFPEAYADNMSWDAVPAPAGAALLGLGGLAMARRRR